MKFGVGAALRRKEDYAFVTGAGRYLADRLPKGTVAGMVVRSPAAHARFTIGDLDAIRSMPGVLAVLTAADVAHLKPLPCVAPAKNRDGSRTPIPEHPILCRDTVRHVGDAVAFVVAETPAQARDAAEALPVDYETLDAVVDLDGATGAAPIWPEVPGNLAFDWENGDADKTARAFDKAHRVIELTLVNNRVVANFMEPRGAIGLYDPKSGQYTLHVSSQGAHLILNVLAARVFELPPERFRILTPDVGGGFGTKYFVYREYPLVLVAAEKVGRPVAWFSDRTEHFLADYQGRDNVSTARLALNRRGRILGLQVDTRANMGAYLSQLGPFIPTNGSAMVPGVYDVPAVHVRVRGYYTNTVSLDAYRGAGRPEAAYLIERLIDKAGLETGIGAAEIRRRNFIAPAQMPHKTQTGRVYDSGEFLPQMELALERADAAGIKERVRQARKRGRLRGLGLAVYIEACAGGAEERATVRIDKDGKATVLIGTQSSGQGHATAYAQMVSEVLGIDPEDVTMVQGDTALIATGGGTGGSRSIPVGSVAIEGASRTIAEKLKQKAADRLEASPADLELADGAVRVVGTDRAVAIAEIAAAARPGELTANDGFRPTNFTFPNGTHVVEVEIDEETGVVETVSYVVVDDFGVTLNPLLLEGQVHGGIAQGLGQALLERTVYDPDSGQLLTASFMDYCMPRADDMPPIRFETRNVPARDNPLGIKGAGEAGTIGACPAVINAVVDALYRAYGVTHVDMPATPEAVWTAIREAKAGRTGR